MIPDVTQMPAPDEPQSSRRLRRLRWASFGVMVVSSLGLLLTQGGWQPTLPDLRGLVLPGQTAAGQAGSSVERRPARRQAAPDFELGLFDGSTLRLADLRGRGVVLNFWASWCVPCREEAPLFTRLAERVRDRGVIVVGVNVQDIDADARAFLTEFDVSYPNGPDRDLRLSTDYGVAGIPTTVFIDTRGLVARRWVGVLNESQLSGFAEEIVP